MLYSSIVEKVAHYRNKLDKLREDEYFVSHNEDFGQDSIK